MARIYAAARKASFSPLSHAACGRHKNLGFCPEADKRADSGPTCEECHGFMRRTRADGGRHGNLIKLYVFLAGRRRADDSPTAAFQKKSTGRQRPTGGRHPPFLQKPRKSCPAPSKDFKKGQPPRCSARSVGACSAMRWRLRAIAVTAAWAMGSTQWAVYMLSTVEPKSCCGRSREPQMYFHTFGA